MTRRRVLAIGLDGFEPTIADRLMAEGRLPALRQLRDRSACFQLDHGEAKRTGLAWEHVSLGQSPEASGRWAAVHFDPDTYRVAQRGTSRRPFLAHLDVRGAIFDAPYFDLSAAPNCSGLVGWGAHDAGVPTHSVPAPLAGEMLARFGPYPAPEFIYGLVWNDPARARMMADALARAVEVRADAARWLFAERLREWDLAMVVVSEFHSAIEAAWHGIDPLHPLHHAPSAPAARDGIVGVYEAADRMVGLLCESLPDCAVVLFSMHGMGPNDSDLATMLLLPELLYRVRFAKPLFVPDPEWVAARHDNPPLPPGRDWTEAVNASLPDPTPAWRSLGERMLDRVRRRQRTLRFMPSMLKRRESSVSWMPATRYRSFWAQMEAFALPSYYDGRIRINLAGRERDGRVALCDYESTCAEIADLLNACRSARTGEPIVRAIDMPVRIDPLRATETQADLIIVWRGAPLGIVHPALGLVGPAPYRRTGGHSGGHGVAYVAASDCAVGDHGVRSAFDVVPTLIHLLGVATPRHVSGASLLSAPPSLVRG
jgi:predicted AlkP superfamily phosphohydrolase/phosphomutase